MTQEIYWELLAWLFRSFLAVTAFAFVVAGYQTCAAARAGAAAVKIGGQGAGLPSVTECRPAF